MVVLFDPEADATMVRLDADPGRAGLVSRLDRVLDALADDPTQVALRRHRFQRPAAWAVVVDGAPDEDDWIVLWQLVGQDVHVLHIGPASFP